MARRWRAISSNASRCRDRASPPDRRPRRRIAAPYLFRNRGRFSRFERPSRWPSRTHQPVDPTLTRRPMTRLGARPQHRRQAVTGARGLFAPRRHRRRRDRALDFTRCCRQRGTGRRAAENAWKRPDDRIGLAAVINGISKAHQRYLQAGASASSSVTGSCPIRATSGSRKPFMTGDRFTAST